jgi:hypothetical protein
MKLRKTLGLGGGSLLALFTLWATLHAGGQSAPVLKIALTGTNQVTVTVTNGIATNLYELFYTPFLGSNANWQPLSDGIIGQTNFTFMIDQTQFGFFRALTGNDLDGDGIPNYKDARPLDPTVGIMTITIESPANGASIP